MNKSITTATLILFFIAAGVLHYTGFKLVYAPDPYPETTAYLGNPYIGYYHIYGYVIKDEAAYPTPGDVPNVPDENSQTVERLVQVQINLCRFKEQPLTDTALEQLDNILAAWCSTDYSLLLRFIYDWDGNALEAEPEDISMLLLHMEQVAPVYNRYADHILSLQGLFTGNNGEMHHTNYSSPEEMRQLATKLAETADPSIYLAVRTPYQWRYITGVETYEELSAIPGDPFLDRLGLYNDGMFGTGADTGTYIDRPREEEIAFQDVLCQTVPNGGEAIIDNPYNDLDNAIADMKLMHVSYLNSVHDPAVLNKWKNTTYTGSDAFNGVTGYDYIRNHLGYRFVLRSTEMLQNGDRDQAALRICIENAGFSRSYRGFLFRLSLVNTSTGEVFTVTPEEDSSCLASGETTALDIPLDVESYSPGSYELYWQTFDDAFDEAILYGNDMPLTERGYLLGTLLIEKPQ